jgi:hypothetical protein
MAAVVFSAGALVAQDDDAGRGVARLGLIQGDVSVRRGDSGEWVAAAPNAPLVVEDRVLSGMGSKAEVQLDHANYVRLWESAEIRLSQLEYGRYQVQVAQGTVTARVLRDTESEVEISTPSIAIRPLKKGAYRVTVRTDGSTELTVRSGEVEVFTPQGTERLKSGRTMLVRGSQSDPEFQIAEALPRDEWDQWNDGRDRDLERSNSYRYVSDSIYGAEDLDYHGDWVYDAPYGYVWTPRVAAGWSPYSHGRWSWVDWYGWSWVSYDPWGWAPYHYGRWYQGPRGWCWWPGAIRSRHYWSPGLVAWVGFGGGGWNIGVGFGRVGWIPLAPYEPYHRWYGRGYYGRGGNYNNITVVNNVNITNVYRNSRVSNGVMALDADDFRAGRFNNAQRLSQNDVRGASLVRGQLPVTPDRGNLRFSDRDVTGSPRSSDNGRFFSRRSAAPVERISFDEQRRGMDEARRRAFSDSSGGRVTAAPDRGGDRSAAEDRGRGWRRVGENQTPGSDVRGGEVRGADPGTARDRGSDSNWRRFGDTGTRGGGETRGGAIPNGEARGSDAGSRRNSDSGWRRFGDPGGAATRSGRLSNEGSAGPGDAGSSRSRDRSNTDGNSRRFGNPGSSTGSGGAVDSGGRTRSRDSSDGNWQRFGGSRGDSGGSTDTSRGAGWRSDPSGATPRTETPRTEMPRQRLESPAAESPRDSGRSRDRSWRQFDTGSGSSGGESIRVRPPIVRERSSGASRDRGNFGSMDSSGGFDRGGSSRPSRVESGGGSFGGFGGSRGGRMESSGGGFGGGRSSGGGDTGGSRGGAGSPRGGRGR